LIIREESGALKIIILFKWQRKFWSSR